MPVDEVALPDLYARLRHRGRLAAHTVYEECRLRYLGYGRRLLGGHECPSCGRYGHRLGLGGRCRGCGQILHLFELVAEVDQ